MIPTELDISLQQRLGLSSHQITRFCQQWGIKEMSLFGSILTDKFDDNSDIDILIRFDSHTRQGLLTLARIKHELEATKRLSSEFRQQYSAIPWKEIAGMRDILAHQIEG